MFYQTKSAEKDKSETRLQVGKVVPVRGPTENLLEQPWRRRRGTGGRRSKPSSSESEETNTAAADAAGKTTHTRTRPLRRSVLRVLGSANPNPNPNCHTEP